MFDGGRRHASVSECDDCVAQVWPDDPHAVVAVPDERKGEQLVLVTDRENPDRDELIASAHEHGLPEIMLPKRIVTVEALPMLGTGKTDYPAIAELAKR